MQVLDKTQVEAVSKALGEPTRLLSNSYAVFCLKKKIHE